MSLSHDELEAGHPEAANALLLKVLKVRPEDVQVRKHFLRTVPVPGTVPEGQSLGQGQVVRDEGLFLALLPSALVSQEERLEMVRALIHRFPDDTNLLNLAVGLSFEAGKKEEAVKRAFALADFYAANDLPMKAVALYERVFAMDPASAQALERIADLYSRQGIFDKAIETLFVLGELRMNRSQWIEAASAFDRIRSIDPVNAKASMALAQVCVMQGETERASSIIQKQIENDFDKGKDEEGLAFGRTYAAFLLERDLQNEANLELERLARLVLLRGRHEEAMRLFESVAERALALGDVEKFIELSIPEIQFRLKTDDARKIAGAYVKLAIRLFSIQPDKAWVVLEEFVAELKKRETVDVIDESLRELSKTLEDRRDFDNAERVLVRLGNVYADLYRSAEAIRIFESITHRGCEDPMPYLRLADLHAEEGNVPRAIDLYLKSMDLCLRANEPARAESIFKTAFARAPENPDLMTKMAYVYYNLGEWDKALKFYERAITLNPDHHDAVVGMAMTYAKKGMFREMVDLAKRVSSKGWVAEVVEEYKKALQMSLSPSECAMALGGLYRELGLFEQAIFEFQSAAKDPETFVKASNLMGLCYKSQGLENLAIKQFQKALERTDIPEEETLELRYNLALLYEESKRTAEALELYNDILVLDIGYNDVKARVRKLKDAKNLESSP